MFFKILNISIFSLLLTGSWACAGGGGGGGSVDGNDGGSAPVNAEETVRYKKALLKCYKTGGNRIVKIEGTLRCY